LDHPELPPAWFGELDASPCPTLVVDEGVRVVFSNEAARKLFVVANGTERRDETSPGGLIGCLEADKPGGCGQQSACAFCCVRLSVGQVLEGKEVDRQPARMALRQGLSEVRELKLAVSARLAPWPGPRQVLLFLEPGPNEVDDYLRRELEATRRLLDAIPTPVFVKNARREFVFVNQEAAQALGRDAAQVVGRTDADFFRPDVVARLWAEDDRVLHHGEAFDAEQRFEGLEGGHRAVLVRKRRALGLGSEPLVLSTGTDVSELKRTQLDLEESRRRVVEGLDTLLGVIDAIDASIFSVDLQYRYTSFNAAHAEVMRTLYGAEIARGHPLSEYQRVAEDWSMAKANLDRTFAGEAFVVEGLSGDTERTRRSFEVSHAPLRSSGGSVVGAVVVARDVTDRRSSERALQESLERMRQGQKMEAIGQLAGGVAHDFNNLLTVILSAAELGLDGAPAEGSLREEFEEIRGAGLRAQALTRQLLAFSRRQVLQPQVLDLNEKVRDLERLLGRVLGEEVEVRTHLAPDVRNVLMDPNQLEQVILNLAVNGRDAMPGGGTLSIETANVALDADYLENHAGASLGEQVMLAISDTGVGMDAVTLSRVFEPFFTTKERGKGTGLGLSTVYGIVKQSGGSIWAYSEPGQGTTFKVYLPRAPQGSGEQRQAPEGARLRARAGESLLVVEDDDQVRRAATRLLKVLGYGVTAATGLDEALRLVEGGLRFDVLLTDVVMPGGNGVEVARRLLARAPSIGVVFMSGYTDDAIAQHGVLSSGSLFLEKPFTQDSLGRMVRKAMDRVAAPKG
jgi:PAS domain S-box-containing protein